MGLKKRLADNNIKPAAYKQEFVFQGYGNFEKKRVNTPPNYPCFWFDRFCN